MRVGTRWPVGAEAPGSLPGPVRAAVRTVEKELADDGQDTAGWGWTLTWLEGSPVVDLDDGTRIRLTADDVALVTSAVFDAPDEDD